MSNLGEFSSLLQLGVGFGIGLSLFRAPMTLLLEKLARELAHEMDVVDTIQTPAARRLKGELSNLQMDISTNADALNRWNLPFMIAAIVGGLVNWAALILASVNAQRPLTWEEEWLLIGISVGWFLAIGTVVGIVALLLLMPLSKRLKELRRR